MYRENPTLKYRSRPLDQGVCLEGMSRIVSIQGFILTAITCTEKTPTLKYSSRPLDQGECLEGMSR